MQFVQWISSENRILPAQLVIWWMNVQTTSAFEYCATGLSIKQEQFSKRTLNGWLAQMLWKLGDTFLCIPSDTGKYETCWVCQTIERHQKNHGPVHNIQGILFCKHQYCVNDTGWQPAHQGTTSHKHQLKQKWQNVCLICFCFSYRYLRLMNFAEKQ